jgi:hypothetical protein
MPCGSEVSLFSLKLDAIVHFLNLLKVVVFGLVSLELEGRCQEVILSTEQLVSDVNLSGNFKAKQTAFFTLGLDIIEEEGLCFLILHKLFIRGEFNSILLGPLLKQRLLWDNNGDDIGLKGVTINKDLCDVERLSNLLLNLIRGNVLALSKLEDVLLSVNDLKSAILKEDTNITSVNPPFVINAVFSLVGLTEVTLKVVVALVADLAAWCRTALIILILRGVVHVRDIYQFDIQAFVGPAHVATSRVLSPGDGCWGTAFSLSVAFEDLAAESYLEKLEDFLGDGGRSGDHNPDTATKHLLEFVED